MGRIGSCNSPSFASERTTELRHWISAAMQGGCRLEPIGARNGRPIGRDLRCEQFGAVESRAGLHKHFNSAQIRDHVVVLNARPVSSSPDGPRSRVGWGRFEGARMRVKGRTSGDYGQLQKGGVTWPPRLAPAEVAAEVLDDISRRRTRIVTAIRCWQGTSHRRRAGCFPVPGWARATGRGGRIFLAYPVNAYTYYILSVSSDDRQGQRVGAYGESIEPTPIVMKSERDLIHVARNFGDGSMMAQEKTTKLTRREAADETTSSEQLTALAEESHALARIVEKNRSAPVSLLRELSRSEDEATRKGVVTNPRAPYDVLSYLERQFPDVFVNNPALKLYNSVQDDLISWNSLPAKCP